METSRMNVLSICHFSSSTYLPHRHQDHKERPTYQHPLRNVLHVNE